VLTIGATINAAFGSIGQILIMDKRGKLIFINTLISLGGNITLNTLLIPRYGTMGAALATVFTVYFLTNLIAVLEVYYFIDIDTVDYLTLIPVAIAVGSVGVIIAESIVTDVAVVVVAMVAIILVYRRATFVRGLLSAVWDAVKT